jgi:2-C-methyl-D-erythritol 4-phosphate cytidylyltransferase
VVLVVAPGRVDDPEPVDSVVVGADTRSGSVRAGLAAVPDGVDTVVVHDAARPLAGPSLFRRAIASVDGGADCAICAIPIFDTVKRVTKDRVVIETLDRSRLVAVQTPQAFRTSALRQAHEGAPEATDDAALVEALGGVVVVVDGDVRNLKITTAADLLLAETLRGAP